jgi:hypothetical protein
MAANESAARALSSTATSIKFSPCVLKICNLVYTAAVEKSKMVEKFGSQYTVVQLLRYEGVMVGTGAIKKVCVWCTDITYPEETRY